VPACPGGIRGSQPVLDEANVISVLAVWEAQPPWCPPLVETNLAGSSPNCCAGNSAERDGSWRAWLSWVQSSGDRHVHKVVSIQAESLKPIEAPEAYARRTAARARQ
jgi:hypothetical protein